MCQAFSQPMRLTNRGHIPDRIRFRVLVLRREELKPENPEKNPRSNARTNPLMTWWPASNLTHCTTLLFPVDHPTDKTLLKTVDGGSWSQFTSSTLHSAVCYQLPLGTRHCLPKTISEKNIYSITRQVSYMKRILEFSNIDHGISSWNRHSSNLQKTLTIFSLVHLTLSETCLVCTINVALLC